MMVYCVFLLESPHRGDSNEYRQYTIFTLKKKNNLNHDKSPAMGFFQGTQKGVLNSRGKRAIGVEATEVLLYLGQLSMQQKLASFHIMIKTKT